MVFQQTYSRYDSHREVLDLNQSIMKDRLAVRVIGLNDDKKFRQKPAFEDDRRACLAAGMDDFLTKPLTESALRAVLARWVGWTDAARGAKVAS